MVALLVALIFGTLFVPLNEGAMSTQIVHERVALSFCLLACLVFAHEQRQQSPAVAMLLLHIDTIARILAWKTKKKPFTDWLSL